MSFCYSLKMSLTKDERIEVIVLSGPVEWAARSPDLNPLDYLFWGMLKAQVYSVKIRHESSEATHH